MTFSIVQNSISKIEKIRLMGEKAHQEMMSGLRRETMEQANIVRLKPKKAGVMVLLYPDADEQARLVLILRKTYKGVHSGQIGFPGGREETYDEDIQATALRETYEEVGVRPGLITVVKSLTSVYIPPSNFMMHPFLGYATSTPQFKRQEEEVDAILEINLSDFLAPERLTTQELSTSYAEKMVVPAFLLNDQVVWGATAMVLNEVRHLLLNTIEEA